MHTMTWAMLPIWNDCHRRYPSPVSPAIISDATTISQAIPMPTAMPVTMEGMVAGRIILQKRSLGVEPRDRAARLNARSMVEAPPMVFNSTIQKAPRKTMKTTLCSRVGQNTMEMGIQATGGIGRRISTIGLAGYFSSALIRALGGFATPWLRLH